MPLGKKFLFLFERFTTPPGSSPRDRQQGKYKNVQAWWCGMQKGKQVILLPGREFSSGVCLPCLFGDGLQRRQHPSPLMEHRPRHASSPCPRHKRACPASPFCSPQREGVPFRQSTGSPGGPGPLLGPACKEGRSLPPLPPSSSHEAKARVRKRQKDYVSSELNVGNLQG